MSLIIDAIKKAQQVRWQEFKSIPFSPNSHPTPKKRLKGLANWWMAIPIGLAGLLVLFLIWERPAPPPLPAPQAEPTVVLQEKEGTIPLPDKRGKGLSPDRPSPPAVKKFAANVESTDEKMEAPLAKAPVKGKKVEKMQAAETNLAPQGTLFPLDSPLKQEAASAESWAKEKEEENTPLPPSGTLQAKAPPKSLATEEEKGTPLPPSSSPKVGVYQESWATKKEEGGEATRAADVLTQFNRGVHFSNQRETIKAIQAYQKVLEIDPTYVEAYNNLGILYQEMGDFEKARKAYQMAVDINPHYEKALNNLGILYYLQGRYEESMGALQRALGVNPNNVESLINLGILVKKRGQLEQAMESFQKALTLNPLQGEIHYNLGLVYEQAKKFQLAIEHYQTFINLSAKTHSVLVREVRRHVNDLWKTAKEKN